MHIDAIILRLACPECTVELLLRVTNRGNMTEHNTVFVHPRVDNCSKSGLKFKPPTVRVEEDQQVPTDPFLLIDVTRHDTTADTFIEVPALPPAPPIKETWGRLDKYRQLLTCCICLEPTEGKEVHQLVRGDRCVCNKCHGDLCNDGPNTDRG